MRLPYRFGRVLPALVLGCLALAGPTRAGTVSGVVRDATTGLPVAGVDIDVFDERLRLDDGFVVSTAGDGSYTIAGVEGTIYVRADLTVAQGKCDQFWPGTFEPSLAQTIAVGPSSTITGIDFDLVDGVFLQGIVIASDTSAPLAGVDLDLLDTAGAFISGVDAFTGGDGSFSLGLVPPGQYILKADPTLAQGYVPVHHPDSPSRAGGVPIAVGATNVAGLNFTLFPGGSISGVVTQAIDGAPVVDLDLDLYDVFFQELPDFDGLTDEVGAYTFGIVPVGTYYVLADAIGDQPYEDSFYGQSTTIQGATPVTVTKGQATIGIDVALTLRGFITGVVTDAATGLPLSGVDIDVLTPAGVNLPQYDADTVADGTYRIGPLASGTYLVRADVGATSPYVDEYHPNSFRLSGATAIGVGTSVVGNVDFALERGGWIRGTVTRASNGAPVAAVDLDLIFPDGEPIPSVDADTDTLGGYRIGPVPTGTYVVRADPDPVLGLEIQYWSQATTLLEATTVQVLVGLDTPSIDFSLNTPGPTATPLPPGSQLEIVQMPTPNPFSQATVLRLRRGSVPPPEMQIFDVRGRLVRRLTLPSASPGEEMLLRWDGRGEHGQAMASGVYFLRLGTQKNDPTLKILRVR